ncbi:hypothetical protein Ahia01_000659300, partial [Argonauta hians]
MAETMKFSPEWLQKASSVATPPSSPGFGKFKRADYRYGREEMLALFVPSCKIPEDLKQFSYILVDKPQDPLAYIPLTEEEQRLMCQSVNSCVVLRQSGRGGTSGRGGRGGGERGRGRGRGRAEGFGQRLSYDDGETSSFARNRSRENWDDRRYERSYSARSFEDGGGTHPAKEYSRSFSSENWRDKKALDDDEGDWRKACSQRWGSVMPLLSEEDDEGDWRKMSPRWGQASQRWRGLDTDRTKSTTGIGFFKDRQHTFDRDRDRPRSFQRSRSTEMWDDGDMPEWSVPNDEDYNETGTFDSNGIFVSNKDPMKDAAMKGQRREKKGIAVIHDEHWDDQ